MKQRVITFLLIIPIILTLLTPLRVSATTTESTTTEKGTTEEKKDSTTNGADGSWCTIRLDQANYLSGGCTFFASWHMVQNSGTCKTEYQSPACIEPNDTASQQTKDLVSTYKGEWWVTDVGLKNSGIMPFMNDSTTSAWEQPAVDTSKVKDAEVTSDNLQFVTGVGKVKFTSEDKFEDVLQAFQAMYNAGYWMIIGIQNSAGNAYSKSAGSHTAHHWIMVSGVTNEDVYLNDSSYRGWNSSLKEFYNQGEWVSYIVPFTNASVTLKTASHGTNAGTATDDEGNATGENTIGLSQEAMMGGLTEKELSAYCQLSEANIQDMYISDAQIENLSQSEVQSVDSWKDNIGMNDADKGFRGVLRRLVQLFGILLTLWALLLYIAYWVDRLNNFIEIDLVSILTFGKFRISDSEDESTYKMFHNKGKGQRTVNHRNIITISVIALAFGALLMTGTLYKAITKLVIFIIHIFK